LLSSSSGSGGCAILWSTKDVVCWGDVASFEPSTDRYVDVSVGTGAVCAIHEAGRGIECHGRDDYWASGLNLPRSTFPPSAPAARQYQHLEGQHQHFEATYTGFSSASPAAARSPAPRATTSWRSASSSAPSRAAATPTAGGPNQRRLFRVD
jgi:hypothetical protein